MNVITADAILMNDINCFKHSVRMRYYVAFTSKLI